MEKKYQVFVSSTYEDLKEERQQVIQALLELDCIPSGMELFPAADEDQWSLIKGVIDECDYYILILGGRYGSIGEDGMGYTEKEYRYALESGKPIISFLHKEPGTISKDKSEKSTKGQKRFEDFRLLAQKKMCKFWETPEELGGVVSRGIVNLRKKHPGIGWVRGDMVPSKEASLENLELRKEIDRLNLQLTEARILAPPGTEKFANGDDVFTIKYRILFFDDSNYKTISYKEEYESTWNEIFYCLSPEMINEAANDQLMTAMNEFLSKYCSSEFVASIRESNKNYSYNGCKIDKEIFQTIVVQLRALGLIKRNEKNRSIKDTATYWTLTPYGDNVMTQLRAIQKEERI